MAIVSYRAMDRNGLEVAGALDVEDRADAAASLRSRGLFVVELRAQNSAHAPAETPADGEAPPTRPMFRVRGRHVEDALRRLSLMTRSGLTVLQALEVAAQQTRSKPLRRSLERVADSVRNGASLSAAFEREGGVVPSIVARMVAAAEASGELDVVLERVALSLERSRDVRAGLATSLVYPAIVVLMSIAVGAYLALAVIPKFSRFLATKDVPLPATTKALLAAPDFVAAWGPPALVLVVGGAVALWFWRRTPKGGPVVDGAALRVPVIGGLFAAASLAQGCRTLALLLRSGVTLLEALRIAGTAAPNRAIALRFQTAAGDVLRGRPLSESLRGRPLPDLVSQVAHVGERTGELDKVLEELGTYYERELAIGAKRAATLFEPTVVIAIGAVVGFVYYAFFQAAFALAR